LKSYFSFSGIVHVEVITAAVIGTSRIVAVLGEVKIVVKNQNVVVGAKSKYVFC
jgi:hypothetical protein